MTIFNSYVSLPEGIQNSIGNRPVPSNLKVLTSMVVEKNVTSKKSKVLTSCYIQTKVASTRTRAKIRAACGRAAVARSAPYMCKAKKNGEDPSDYFCGNLNPQGLVR